MPRTKQFDEQKVLELAMELFWEKGFHATSMQDLVDHLGINRASLYDTYGDKQTLFEKAFEAYMGPNFAQVAASLEAEPDVAHAFRQLFSQSLIKACEEPERKGCFMVNTTAEFVPAFPDMTERLQRHKDRLQAIFRKRLDRALQEGQLAPDTDTEALSSYFFSFYSGLMLTTKLESDPQILQRVVENALSVLHATT